ncbi:MAG TPA: chloramphenicol acetyltransferase [Firmicutes bacterium]|nr:chloramphenicol acetyltransferase [Bacillota bacterium]
MGGGKRVNGYKVIDMDSWKRRIHCAVFQNYALPQYCITAELDVTEFYKNIKKRNKSFTFSMMYLIGKNANAIEEFRYRFLGGDVVLFDRIDTAFTYMDEDSDLFKVVRAEMTDDIDEYISAARNAAENQKEYFTGPLGNDVFQFSALPWIQYTHVSHTFSGDPKCATPLFDWGRFYERGGKLWLPFSVQAHHSFVDGIHIGRLIDSIQTDLNEDPWR